MMKTRRTRATLLAVLVVAGAVLAGFAGTAAALSSTSITATDTAAATATDHTIQTTVDASGTVKSVVVSYDGSNVELLEEEDIMFEHNGATKTVGSISIVNETAVKVTLDSGLSVASTDTINISTANEHVVNPYETGTETVRITTRDSNGNDLATATATFSVTKAGADSVVVVSSRSDDFEAASEELPVIGLELPTVLGFGGQDYARQSAEDVPVNGSDANASITFMYADADAEDSLETAYEDVADGAWTKSVLMTADGSPVPAFKDEAPDEDWFDEDEHTYGIVDSSTNSVVLELGDDYDDETEVGDVVVNANKGWSGQLDVYGLSLITGPGGAMGFGALLAGLVLFGRPRIQA